MTDEVRSSRESAYTSCGRVGRPSKKFSSSGERSKRRKVSEIWEANSAEELTLSAEMNLRASGSHAATDVTILIIAGKAFPPETFLQKRWDIINKTSFLVAQRKESNAWLHAFPSRNIGTFMNNKILKCVYRYFKTTFCFLQWFIAR
jgi:hypothetical protein